MRTAGAKPRRPEGRKSGAMPLLERAPEAGGAAPRAARRHHLEIALDAAKVLVERIDWVRLRFREGPAEFALDAVNRVKERSPVDLQLARAKTPVRAQQEVVAEEAVLGFVERTTGNQSEVRHVFFTLPGVSPAAS